MLEKLSRGAKLVANFSLSATMLSSRRMEGDVITWKLVQYPLHFAKPARTSRGEMQTHTAYFLHLLIQSPNEDRISDNHGIGEASPLAGLSPETGADLEEIVSDWNAQSLWPEDVMEMRWELPASLRFAFEVAVLSACKKMWNHIFQTPFSQGLAGIPCNGLVWMNELETMEMDALGLLRRGATTIKLKVGQHDFDSEIALITRLKQVFPEARIRVDANGAFGFEDALEKLKALHDAGVESIEQPIKAAHNSRTQPIKAGQWVAMAELCAKSPLPIALDEELIGMAGHGKEAEKWLTEMLQTIRPQFLIIKPTLLGGLELMEIAIQIAARLEISWWVTSALESNVGLQAIAQTVAFHEPTIAQGLGTGGLYTNNILAPIYMHRDALYLNPAGAWGIVPEA
jgi:o-succinylbenzoate synthase